MLIPTPPRKPLISQISRDRFSAPKSTKFMKSPFPSNGRIFGYSSGGRDELLRGSGSDSRPAASAGRGEDEFDRLRSSLRRDESMLTQQNVSKSPYRNMKIGHVMFKVTFSLFSYINQSACSTLD